MLLVLVCDCGGSCGCQVGEPIRIVAVEEVVAARRCSVSAAAAAAAERCFDRRCGSVVVAAVEQEIVGVRGCRRRRRCRRSRRGGR